jgi:hypothetical protein
MVRAPIDDLIHRLNNLLGTIELQAAVARHKNDLEGCLEALRLITESADRTREEVQRFRNSGGDVTGPAAR